MAYIDLTSKTEKELQALLAQKRDALRELRFKVSEGQLKQTHLISEMKRDVAHVLTALNARRHDEANQQ